MGSEGFSHNIYIYIYFFFFSSFFFDFRKWVLRESCRKVSKRFLTLFVEFWRFLPSAKNVEKCRKIWRFLTIFDAAPFRWLLLRSAERRGGPKRAMVAIGWPGNKMFRSCDRRAQVLHFLAISYGRWANFRKSSAIQMGGVLQYKWEAYCDINGKSTDNMALSSERRGTKSTAIQIGGVLRYFFEKYWARLHRG